MQLNVPHSGATCRNGVAGRVTGDKPGWDRAMALRTDCLGELMPPFDLWWKREVADCLTRLRRIPVNPQDVSKPGGPLPGNAYPAPRQKADGIPAPSTQESGVDRPELAALKRLPPSDPT